MYISIKKIIMRLTKLLFTFLFLLSTCVFSQTTSCPEGTNAATFDNWTTILKEGIPDLKNLRKWVRLNKDHPSISLKDLKQMELVTNRLEYMANDLVRYINKYKNSNMEAVCKYVFIKHKTYLGDYLYLTHALFDTIDPTPEAKFSNVDIWKYK